MQPYNPPNKTIPYDFFTDFEKKKSSFILVGDLNAKSRSISCNSNNISGGVLDDILSETSIIIHNDNSPTYNRFGSLYTEKLDLVLSSSDIGNKINKFKVLSDSCMGSDNYQINLRVYNKFISEILSKIRLNLEKADWIKFKAILEDIAKKIQQETLGSLSTSELSDMITKQITKAAEESQQDSLKHSTRRRSSAKHLPQAFAL